MNRFFYLIAALQLITTTITAEDEWINLISEPTDENEESDFITFDDFPDNSEPDLEALFDPKKQALIAKSPFGDHEELDVHFNDLYGFPCAMIDGCVNIITGDFHDFSIDFSMPGAVPFELGRLYCGSGCRKHSLFNGWQLNHGAKLLTYHKDFEEHAFIKGGDRHGLHFAKETFECCATCPDKFFKSYVTNCCFGDIGGKTNLRNEVLHERGLSYALEHADCNWTYFKKSSGDPERESKTHGYKLEKWLLSSGNFYTYDYSESFGMPTRISQFNSQEKKIGEFKLLRDTFSRNHELTYRTPTNEYVNYRFKLYGKGSNRRAVLEEINRPHAPNIRYDYEIVRGHYKQKRICQRTLPEGRVLQIAYARKKVSQLLAPAGENNSLVPTHSFYNFKEGNIRIGQVETGIGGLKEYSWNKKDKRIAAICSFDEARKLFLKERFRWGDANHDGSHLTARILENKFGQWLSYQKYHYDRFGNVIRLSHYGNLTGNASFVNPEDLSQSDVHHRIFKYDNLHRRIYEDDGRVVNTYTYFNNTHLIAAKYTQYDDHIQLRHFYLYDAVGAIEREWIDDGAALDKDDLSGVLQRTMKYYRNNKLGLPEIVWEYALDLANGEKRLIHKSVNTYDSHGWKVAQAVYNCHKEHQYTLRWQHDDHGNAVYFKDAMGHVTVSKYDVNDNLIFEQKPDCAARFLEYDCMNRLTREEQKDDHGAAQVKTYAYDVMGNCVSCVDIHGETLSHGYDTQGRLIKTTKPSFNQTDAHPEYTYTRDALGHVVSINDGNGNCTKKEYTIKGKPTLIVYPDGTTERHEYTLWGDVAKTTMRDGSLITYTYDPQGRETKREWFDSEGHSLKATTKTYNAFHLISESDAKGIQTSYTYDCAGRLSKKTVGNAIESYEYDAMGREHKLSIASDQGVIISYVKNYDHLNRVIERYTEHPDGTVADRIVQKYDANGNEKERHTWNQADQATTKTQYDAFGRVVCVKNALGESTHTTYSDNGLRIEVTNPLGVKRVTLNNTYGDPLLEQCFDPMGQLVEEISYEYDKNGNRIQRTVQTESEPIRTKWHYDNLDQLIKTVEAAGTTDQKQVQRQYDHMGRLKTVVKNDGVHLTFTYDALGRKTSVKSSDGTIHHTFSYDLNDNLLTAHDAINRVTLAREYDAFNQLTKETLPNQTIMKYRYDPLGQVKQIVLPDQTTIDYAYQADRLLAIGRQGSINYTHQYKEYNASSYPIVMQLAGNAGESTIDYDRLNRPVCIKAPHFNESYRYHAHLLNQRTTDDAFGKTNSSFTYDAKDQLLSENGMADQSFAYDWQGNPVSYNQQKRRFNRCNALLKDKTGKYLYDLNGNRLADGLNTYQYDALDRLISVNTPTGSYRYTYDPLGRRLAKSDQHNTTYFLWQKDQEIGSLSKDGQIKELRILGLSNQAVAYELEEKLYIPLHDNLGNVRVLLDETGTCLSSYRYSAFGKEEMQGDLQSPWRFSGKHVDPETGFNYFGKRYYNPRTLNWLTPDPLGETDGPNYYAFVHNNPLHYIDPDGTFAFVAAPIVFELFAISWGAAAEVAFTWLTVETAVATAIGAAAGVAVYNAGGEITRDDIENDKKQRNKPPKPDPKAEENPHTIIERPGKDGQYTTHYGDGTYKQYRGSGKPHGNIPRPNVKENKLETNQKTGKSYPGKGNVRKPRPDEIPKY